jgi:pimeloyl-ACP methyl ester carboxylesterase
MSPSEANEITPSVTLRMGRPFGPAVEDRPASRAGAAFQEVVAQATAETVPSGILDTTPPRFLPLRYTDGSEDSPVVSQAEWQACLETLLTSRLEPPAAGSVATSMLDANVVEARAAAHRARGHVPLFVADLDYHAIRGRVWVAMERAAQSSGAASRLSLNRSTDLFEPRRCFLASAILPTVFAGFALTPQAHYDRTIVFVLPSDGLLGSASNLTHVTIDFGDGAGARDIERDRPVTVTYNDFGPKVVTLSATGPKGPGTANFRVDIEESIEASLQADGHTLEQWPDITARVAWPGTTPSVAQVRVLRRANRPLTKPVLLIEGFPGNYPWETIERYIRKGRFAEQLLARDHDLVLVRFLSGPVRLQNNAYALVEVIREVIRRRQGSDNLIVGGFSMGGLLARYALAYMEHEHTANPGQMPHHETRVLFTVDTPHEGANVPVSAQALAQYYATLGSGERAALMRSAAAQQMVYISVPPLGEWKDGLVIGPSPLRKEFLDELVRVGGPDGMPREVPSTIAVANGEGTGKEWLPAGRLTTKFACIWWGDCYAYPRQPGQPVVAGGNTFNSIWRMEANQGIAFDSAPGGVFEEPIFREIFNAGRGFKEIHHDNACFVPTTSALAISGLDRFFTVPDLSRSKFKYVTFSWEGNLKHAWLSETLADFLIKFIGQAAESPAASIAGQ